MVLKAQVITGDDTHPAVQNLHGWSVTGGTIVFRLRKDGLVTGDIIGYVSGDSHVVYPIAIDAQGGCFFEIVSGTLTEGVLYYI